MQQWTEVMGADAESRQLQLAAPFAGFVVDVARDVAPGQVVARQEVLARVIDPSRWIAEVYVDEDDVKRLTPHRSYPGNVPSSTIWVDALTPRSMGALMALYEHKIFCQAAIWGIHAYDQWGVELGKKMAKDIEAAEAARQKAG